MNLDFPLLRAEQIECKVKKVTAKGAVVLLYKTARTDMDMLDRIVGKHNWKNSYREIDGVLYCTISIWDDEKQTWIDKEDCGIESREDDGNEKKGEASDAFKRAGFRVGIGRELYSAPFIFVRVPTEKVGAGYKLKDIGMKFTVNHIAYDNERRISELVICDSSGTEWFRMGEKRSTVNTPTSAPVNTSLLTQKSDESDAAIPNDSGTDDPHEKILETMRAEVVKHTKGKPMSIKQQTAALIKKLNNGDANYRAITDVSVAQGIIEALNDLGGESIA